MADTTHTDQNKNNAIVLAIINFIYLMLSVILLVPTMYWESTANLFSGAYGAASAVYSLGILYSFFEKALTVSDILEDKIQRITHIGQVILAILNIGSVSSYYIIWKCSTMIWVAYVCLVLTAALSLFQAARSALDYINDK